LGISLDSKQLSGKGGAWIKGQGEFGHDELTIITNQFAD
jgi:hypothetical protein